MLKSIKARFNKLMESIATQNNKSFGNQKLDCCDLNKGKLKAKPKDEGKK